MKYALSGLSALAFGGGPKGLDCVDGVPLAHGVARSVSVPSGDRWYRFTVAETGVLSTAFTLSGGTGTITVYVGGSCENLPSPSVATTSLTAFDPATFSVTAGDVVRVKITQSTGTLTGSLTVRPAGIVSAATTVEGDGVAVTFSAAASTQPFSGELAIKVNGVTRWIWDDLADAAADVGLTSTITFTGTPIAHGDTVTVTSTGPNFFFGNGGTNPPDFTDFPVTNLVP